jgi:hypothetical protein
VKEKETSMDTLIKAAQRAVEDLEALELGHAWQDPAREAQRAVAALASAAEDVLAPATVTPLGAGVAGDLDAYLTTAQRATYGADVARIHAAAVATYPSLAAALRNRLVTVPRIRAAAAAMAQVLNSDPGELADAWEREYLRRVAADLHAAGELEPASGALGELVPALEGRLRVALDRHGAHAREEAERRAAQEAAVAAAVAEEERRQQQEREQAARDAERAAVAARREAHVARAAAAVKRLKRLKVDSLYLSRYRAPFAADALISHLADAATDFIAAVELALDELESGRAA